MNRKRFLSTLGTLPLAVPVMKLQGLLSGLDDSGPYPEMPVLFVGHGNPMNAIEDNAFSRGMKEVSKRIPRPRAILVVSAHWETEGTWVTRETNPKTIHDFGGFPQALFDVQYPAPGSPQLAREAKELVKVTEVGLSDQWGLDHGCWSVTRNLYPAADIPVIQMSLDYRRSGPQHLEIARELKELRRRGVLVIGSGNMVHNFSHAALKPGTDFNTPFGHDWALEANELFKKLILANDNASLANYRNLGRAVGLAVPTPEHYLPLLYATALRDDNDEVSFFNDAAVAGSFTMTSVLIGA
jgi:4,5-DOPA dioxygenase extradiol